MLTKEAILTAQDIVTETVSVPEWGGEVLVRGMTGRERDVFEQAIIQRKGRDTNVNMRDLRAKLAAFCMVDEGGQRIFTDGDVETLSGKSAAALQRVFDVASRLSGLTPADAEELTKN